METSKWKMIFDATAAVLAVILAFIYGFQLNVMKRQLDLMERSAKLDSRAWLTASVEEFDLTERSALRVPVKIKNLGKTPARVITGEISVQLLPKYTEPEFLYGEGKLHAGLNLGTLAPGEEQGKDYFLLINKTGIPEHGLITHDQALSFGQGESYIVTHGKLKYQDIFGSDHWVTFCTAAGNTPDATSGGAKKCKEWNEIDSEN